MNARTASKVLLIGEAESLHKGLVEAGFAVLAVQESDDLYAICETHEPVAILLSSDSPSRDTLEHLASLGRKYPQPALLLHQQANPELTEQALSLGISAYVSEGLTPAAVKSLIEVSINHAQQVHALRRELARKQQSLSDRKLIDEAKRVLWKQHGMNEETAYKALKTMAMNSRCNIATAAARLLDSKDKPK